MGTIDGMLVDMEEKIVNAEGVKECVCHTLIDLGLLTEEKAQQFCKDYGMIIIKQSWYKKIFTGDKYIMKCVKLNTSKEIINE